MSVADDTRRSTAKFLDDDETKIVLCPASSSSSMQRTAGYTAPAIFRHIIPKVAGRSIFDHSHDGHVTLTYPQLRLYIG